MDDAALTRQASVVICARNRAGHLVATLESVVRNDPGEIVVVDDRSTDDTAAVARRYTDAVVPSGGNGLAAARQLGAEQAHNPYVVYVDSDVVVEAGCLARLIEALERNPGYGAVTATREPSGPGSYWTRRAREARRYARPTSSGLRDSFPCTTVAIRRHLIDEIRFDPFFVGAGEDIDFSTRLRKAGWDIYDCPDAVVFHSARASFTAFVRQQVWYGRGAARLAYKQALLPETATRRPVERGWRTRLVRERRLGLLPYVVVTGAAHRLGFLLERRRLRNLPPSSGPRDQEGAVVRVGST